MNCTCKEWPPGIAALNRPFITEQARAGHSLSYGLIRWRFCPWCGKRLLMCEACGFDHDVADCPTLRGIVEKATKGKA